MDDEAPHLWETPHPYYCSEGNYYSREPYCHHGSWADFAEAMGSSDPDLNLLFRWDWHRYDADGESVDGPDGTGEPAVRHQFQTFWVMQRKGIFACHEVDVTAEDEPAVRKWLAARLAHLLTLWAPIADVEAARA